MNEKIKDRLKRLIVERGISQSDLSDISGVTQSSISHYLKGDRIPSAGTVVKLAKALGTTSDYLLFGEPFTEDDKLSEAVKMVSQNSAYLTKEQKIQIFESMIE